jgi:hypothetical protein
VEEKAAIGALTRLPILCDLLSCGLPVGRLARHEQSFQAAFKREKTNGLACDIDDIQRDLFGRVGRQNPAGGADPAARGGGLIGASIALACVSAIGVAVGGTLGE